MSGIVIVDVKRLSQIGVIVWDDNGTERNTLLQRTNRIAIPMSRMMIYYNPIIFTQPRTLKAAIMAL